MAQSRNSPCRQDGLGVPGIVCERVAETLERLLVVSLLQVQQSNSGQKLGALRRKLQSFLGASTDLIAARSATFITPTWVLDVLRQDVLNIRKARSYGSLSPLGGFSASARVTADASCNNRTTERYRAQNWLLSPRTLRGLPLAYPVTGIPVCRVQEWITCKRRYWG